MLTKTMVSKNVKVLIDAIVKKSIRLVFLDCFLRLVFQTMSLFIFLEYIFVVDENSLQYLRKVLCFPVFKALSHITSSGPLLQERSY